MTASRVDLMSEVPRAVSAYWEARRAPVLLAALGLQLPPEARAELRVTKQTLRNYIAENLVDQVRLVSIPGKGDAATPVEPTKNFSDTALIRRFDETPRPRAAAGNPRFYPSVWLGFSRPLAHDLRRYIEFPDTGGPRLVDVPSNQDPDPAWREIALSDLPDIQLGFGAPPAPVAEAIRQWAAANEIALESLHAPPREQVAALAAKTPRPTGLPPTFVEILELLDPHELARINIPADLVIKLARKLAKR